MNPRLFIEYKTIGEIAGLVDILGAILGCIAFSGKFISNQKIDLTFIIFNNIEFFGITLAFSAILLFYKRNKKTMNMVKNDKKNMKKKIVTMIEPIFNVLEHHKIKHKKILDNKFKVIIILPSNTLIHSIEMIQINHKISFQIWSDKPESIIKLYSTNRRFFKKLKIKSNNLLQSNLMTIEEAEEFINEILQILVIITKRKGG